MTTVSGGKEIGNSFKKYFSYILFLIAECYIFLFSLYFLFLWRDICNQTYCSL